MGILKDDDEFMGHERTDGVEMVFKDYNDKKHKKIITKTKRRF